MFDTMQSKAISIQAKTFILRRSGTYQGQMHRNYTTNARMGQIGDLVDTITSERITSVTPTLLGTLGHELLSLDTSVANRNPIAVPGGWNNRRGIFILVLEVKMSTGGRINYYIQGYTDSDSFTDTAVDPNMRLYINNIVTANPFQETSAAGSFNSMRVSSNYQTPMDFSATAGYGQPSLMMTRPQDVFGQMKNNDLAIDDVFVIDKSTEISSNLVSTRRRNSLPTSFMSSVLNGFAIGRRESNMADFTSGDVAETAFTQVLEKDAVQDLFLRKLQEANGLARGQAHFSYAELARAVPNLEQVKVPFSNSNAGMQLSQEGDSNHFAGQTLSTLVAVQLAAAVPALMLECMLSTVAINITNMVTGQLQVTPQSAPGCFAPDIATRQFILFRDRLINEVIFPLTERGMININANLTCSFHSEFVIDIKVGDDPNTRFVAPSFCDSLFTPTVTNNPNVIKQLGSDLSVMCDHVSEAISASELRKDKIISRQLMSPMSGALSSNNQAFTVPQPVNTSSMRPYSGPTSNPMNPNGGPMSPRGH